VAPRYNRTRVDSSGDAMEYIFIVALIVGGIAWMAGKSDSHSSSKAQKRPDLSHDFGSQIRSHSADGNGYRRRETNENLTTSFKEFWVPCGRSVDVGGYSIDDGLIYVGKGLAAVNGYSVEPALINPKLRVDQKHPDYGGEGMSYWPAYDRISPRNRAGYLEWLAGGRRDPRAYIGYVFLYFYGLERRILHDYRQGARNADELVAIFNEVKRLLKIYGDNNSFQRYAQQFLFAIYLSGGQADLTGRKPIVAPSLYELPAPLKVGLGQFSKAGLPIPAEWALAWVRQDPEIRLRTPAKRCRKEFAALFKQLYRDRHREGIVVKPNKTPVSPTYRSASGGMSGEFKVYQGPSLPDITALKRPRAMLADLVDRTCDKLDSYSRFIGKDGNDQGSLQSLALLPDELIKKVNHPGLHSLRSVLASHLEGDGSPLLPVQVLLEHFPIQKPDCFSKKEAVLLAQLLEKLGFGIEPDVRFTGIKIRPDDDCIVFEQDSSAPSAPSQAYEAAALLMRMASLVSAADGEISREEQKHLEQHIETSISLEPAERRRLRAHLQWLLAHEQNTAGLKSKLRNLAEPQRETIGQYLIAVAAADGSIDPGEVKILQKLYGHLGLDPTRVPGHLHSATADPVTVKPAAPQSGYSIPAPPEEPTGAEVVPDRAALDPAALQRKMEDTARVSTLLHGIFADDETETEPGPMRVDNAGTEAIVGLDAEHSAFVRALGQHEKWERPALEALAEHLGLLLDGALDIINEAAFDHCDGPCIEEDDDTFVVDRTIYEEMTT